MANYDLRGWTKVGLFTSRETRMMREYLLEAVRLVRKGRAVDFSPRKWAETFYRATLRLKGLPSEEGFILRDALYEAAQGKLVRGVDRTSRYTSNIFVSGLVSQPDQERWATLYGLGSMPVWESLRKDPDGGFILPKGFQSWNTLTNSSHSILIGMNVDPRPTAVVCLSWLVGFEQAQADLKMGPKDQYAEEFLDFCYTVMRAL